ncbi:MAG: FMN-binding protein [Erysipelothrix sp.]|nr:FMN-binding protein [Erysipelothrix sp.]
MKRALYLALFLALTAGLAGGILSLVNDLTKETIATAQIEKERVNLVKIFPDGEFVQKTEEVAEIDGLTDLFEVSGQGYVYKIVSRGYGGEIVYLVGFDENATIKGIAIINHSETPGFGDVIETDGYANLLIGKSATEQLDVSSGATVSSVAINSGIKIAAEHLSGGEIVIEKPEPTLGKKVLISDEKVLKYKATLVSKEGVGVDNMLYTVSAEGYGLKDAEYPSPDYKENVFEIEVDPLTKEIVSITMKEFGDTKGFGDNVDNPKYFELFTGVSSTDTEVDTISEATITSYSLISAVKLVLEDIE